MKTTKQSTWRDIYGDRVKSDTVKHLQVRCYDGFFGGEYYYLVFNFFGLVDTSGYEVSDLISVRINVESLRGLFGKHFFDIIGIGHIEP